MAYKLFKIVKLARQDLLQIPQNGEIDPQGGNCMPFSPKSCSPLNVLVSPKMLQFVVVEKMICMTCFAHKSYFTKHMCVFENITCVRFKET